MYNFSKCLFVILCSWNLYCEIKANVDQGKDTSTEEITPKNIKLSKKDLCK